MKRILLTLALAVLFSGCAHSIRTFDPEDSGTTIQTEPGKTFVIRLPSNPTTGYSWTQDGVPDYSVIRLVQEDFEKPDSELAGAGGFQVFTYHVFGSGEAAIRLIYRRPWEKNPPIETFQMRVLSSKQVSLNELLAPSEPPTTRVGSRGQVENLPE